MTEPSRGARVGRSMWGLPDDHLAGMRRKCAAERDYTKNADLQSNASGENDDESPRILGDVRERSGRDWLDPADRRRSKTAPKDDPDAGRNRFPRTADGRGGDPAGAQSHALQSGQDAPGLFPDLEKLHGDREKDDLKALEGRKWDAVVDSSANVPRWVKKAAAVLGPNIGHYIYISSISVYSDTSKPGTDETAPVATIDDPTTEKIDGRTYGALKALSEKAAKAAMPGRVAVVRPV